MASEKSADTQGGTLREVVTLIGLAGALVALLTVIGAFYWMQSLPEAASAGTPVADRPVELARPSVAVPAPDSPVRHADLYFDFKSARLRAEAARLLQDNAAAMARTEGWVVLVTGYADRHGPPTYNRMLAQRRAEAVKQFLVELGVPETSIKVVTLGQEAALCDDPGQACQQLNRRVHLEIRNLGPVAHAAVGPSSNDVAQP